MYSQISVTVRPNDAYQANFSSAPCLMPRSMKSKSMTRLIEATTMQIRLKMIAMARRPQPEAARREQVGDQIDEHQAEDADRGSDQHAGELRRDPDGPDLVDEQHAGRDHHRSGDRLDDDAGPAFLEDATDRAEQQALARRVDQRVDCVDPHGERHVQTEAETTHEADEEQATGHRGVRGQPPRHGACDQQHGQHGRRANNDVVQGHVAGRGTSAATAATAASEPGRRVGRTAVGRLVVDTFHVARRRRHRRIRRGGACVGCRSRDLELVENGVGGHG